jgi:hypothetical protein
VHASKKTYNVAATRLDTFLCGKGYSPSELTIVFLHIDAQGADLDVLHSLGTYLPCVRAGVLETAASEDTAIYQKQTNTSTVAKETLARLGFVVTNVEPNDHSGVGGVPCEYNVFFQRP